MCLSQEKKKEKKKKKEAMPICSSEIRGKDYLEPLSGSSNLFYGDIARSAIKLAAYS